MSDSSKWLGKMGGGFSASLIGGMSVYQLNMWNMAGGTVPMPVLIIGKRLGLMAQAEAGHAFCLLTGVTSPNEFTKLESAGFDWCLSMGGDADSVVKTAGGLSEILVKSAKGAGNWATNTGTKMAVNKFLSDSGADKPKAQFYLIGTPLSVGLGAGIFYEWQTLTKTGTDVAWRYVKPTWWLENKGGKVLLHMSPLPETDGTTIGLQFRTDIWGADDVLIFDTDRIGNVGFNQTDKLKTVRGTVRSGKLCAYNSSDPGLNLSSLIPHGKLEVGMLSTSRNTEVTRNGSVRLGIDVVKDAFSETNLSMWSSDDYAEVKTDGSGRFASTTDTRFKT